MMTAGLIALYVCGVMAAAGPDPSPVARWRGVEMEGGGAAIFGASQAGEHGVNYVYARSTEGPSTMRAKFELAVVPDRSMFLHLKAQDDDGPGACPIEITLNGHALVNGPNEFPQRDWAQKSYSISAGVLHTGGNELVIANSAPDGRLGMPPWFMVARIAIADEDFDLNAPPPIEEDFFVTLPRDVRPIPEPLAEGRKPGFAIRGTKGWMWKPDQYLAEIPVLVKYKLNFLMNCYTSMCDVEHFRWGDSQCNRWWESIPREKAKAYENVARECMKAGVRFCFSMNPNICTKRIVDYNSAGDVDLLWKHFAWMQGLGVQWFNISLDDITEGIDAAGQTKVVNEIFRRLRAKDPEAAMILCPTFYWGTGEDPTAAAYLDILARELHPEIYVFWTGGAVVGRITRADAEAYKGRVKHRIIVWDNYPVNDAAPTMHLGPVIYRDRDLCGVVDGIMGNPLCPQNEINRIPLLTLADYAWNPEAYDPARSIGQAIAHLADTPQQRCVLKQLVELYPGTLLESKGTGWNPVIARFDETLTRPHSRYLADLFLGHAEDVALRMEAAFPERFKDARQTLLNDIAKMNAAYAAKYARSAN